MEPQARRASWRVVELLGFSKGLEGVSKGSGAVSKGLEAVSKGLGVVSRGAEATAAGKGAGKTDAAFGDLPKLVW